MLLQSILVPRHRAILIGRSGGIVDVVIDHPSVSLRHAKVFHRAASTLVRDLGSSSGTFVDGRRVHGEVELVAGGSLAIGPIRFEFDGIRLVQPREPEAGTAVSCVSVYKYIDDRGDPDKRMTLLHDVSLAIQPGELVCLIGPSGSGKSTLLSILAGRHMPTMGDVFVRGRNLHAELESVKHDVAFVPQVEALYQSLPVRAALSFSAALRLPADTGRAELDTLVTRLLESAGLGDLRGVRIRDLSGGQRKRVSLANEIAHRPSTLFVDEVTSGLDEQGDLEIMSLMRSLTSSGMAVVCITHNTLNIERTAHRVVVLSPGGRLACFGTVDEVRRYFGITRLGDVYGVLNAYSPADWQARFRHSILWRQHIGRLLPPRDQLRDPNDHARPTANKALALAVATRRRRGRAVQQFCLLTTRWIQLQRMDPRPMCMATAQAVFVATLLVVFFGDLAGESNPLHKVSNCRNAAFLLLTSAFWLGCNNAAPEIARERHLFEQERSVTVRPTPYFCSKLWTLGAVAVAQSLVVFALLTYFCNLPGDGGFTGTAQRTAVVAIAGLLGTLLGLAISAQARSEQVAVRAVPIVMIPQIVLADVLSPLSGWLSWFAPATTSTFWTFRAFTGDTSDYHIEGSADGSILKAVVFLLCHACIAGSVTLAGLHRRMMS